MNILHEIENYINEFNQNTGMSFAYDTIRISFRKRYKLERLKEIGTWKKLHKNDKKIRSRLTAKEATSAYKLLDQNIYYYNQPTPPKYDQAVMVIYGMKQYHKEPPDRELINKIMEILKDVSDIDICLDVDYLPNFDLLAKCYNLKPYKHKGTPTDTYYIFKTDIPMIEKVCIYDKAYKNNLEGILWRLEATITIPNSKNLALPLHDFKELTDTSKGVLCKMFTDAIEAKAKKREKIEA